MAIPPGLARYIAEKKAGASSEPTPLQQAAAGKLAGKMTPESKGRFQAKKKKPAAASAKTVPDTDQDGM